MGEEEITIKIKKDDIWKYSTFVLAVLLIVVSIAYVNKDVSTTTRVIDTPTPSGGSVPTPSERVEVSEDNDASIGDPDAPVTIIEFSDYECPFCGRFFSETYGLLKEQYIDTGKVRLVFRDFPLSFHPMAKPAAEAAECVRSEGGDDAYFEYHDLIFNNQALLSEDALVEWADGLGYDIQDCLDSGEFSAEVSADFAAGQAAGVSGTPTFFVNGKILVGAQPYSAFKQVIDAELA